jgi:hypothetical protein
MPAARRHRPTIQDICLPALVTNPIQPPYPALRRNIAAITDTITTTITATITDTITATITATITDTITAH